jgi:hypothetical protein
LVNAHDIVRLKFVRHSAVANAGHHGGHAGAQLHEVLGADRVKETLAKDNVAEFEAVKGGMSSHVEWTIDRQL